MNVEKRLPKRYYELAEIVGEDGAVKLCRAFGGDKLYIPKADRLDQRERNRRIRREYDGFNKAALAERYGLSIRRIETILGRRETKTI